MERTFIVNTSQKLSHPYIHGTTPVSAALKGFNASCKSKKVCADIVKVVDSQTNKEYAYKIKRINKPKTVILDSVPVKFRFATKSKSVDPSKVATLRKSLSKPKSKPKKSTKSKKSKTSLRKCVQVCLKA